MLRDDYWPGEGLNMMGSWGLNSGGRLLNKALHYNHHFFHLSLHLVEKMKRSSLTLSNTQKYHSLDILIDMQ